MKESIHKYFKVGTIQWMSFPNSAPLDSLLAIARDDYFDAVELTGYGADQDKAKAILDQSHLTVCFGAHPIELKNKLNPNALDEAERQKAEDVLKQTIDEAEYLGSKGVTFLMDKAALIGPAPLAPRFAADMRTTHNNFGLVVDLSHFPTTYETSRFVIRTLRPYISHFHFGNAVVKPGCDGYGDKHPRFGYPNSANDVAEMLDFLRVLKEEGFFDAENPYVLSAEVTLRPGEDEGIVLANTKRVLNRAWALLED